METGCPEILLKRPLRITSTDDLEDLNRLMHDEYFDLSDVTFHKELRTVEIPYRRIFHDGPSRVIRNWLIFKTVEVNVIRAGVTVHNVEEYTFKDSARIGTFAFNTISYDNGVLRFECCEPLELRMVVSKIDIESRDIEIRGKARITHGLFWSADSGRVYP
ncbi:MAG: hypothetical protein ACYTBJ_08610 [Planctomycetota bacterium]|jgi:hypothetical protein